MYSRNTFLYWMLWAICLPVRTHAQTWTNYINALVHGKSNSFITPFSLKIVMMTLSKRMSLGLMFFYPFILHIQATTRYVKPVATGLGDGSSWTNASSDLQAMIQASSSSDAVWIAAGTYKPTNKPFQK